MPIFTRTNLLASIIAPTAAVGIYALAINYRISPSRRTPVILTDSTSKSFSSSPTQNIVNPRHHVTRSHSIFMPLKSEVQGNDEELLARFVKGFFGGLVFAPESFLLRAALFKPALFSSLKPEYTSREIWNTSEIPSKILPAQHTTICGAFHVLDVSLEDKNSPSTSQDSPGSYVDFGYRSDKLGIAGIHRFSVLRNVSLPSDDTSQNDPENHALVIKMECMVCNPTQNQPLKSETLFNFHLVYATLLMKEGVSTIYRSI